MSTPAATGAQNRTSPPGLPATQHETTHMQWPWRSEVQRGEKGDGTLAADLDARTQLVDQTTDRGEAFVALHRPTSATVTIDTEHALYPNETYVLSTAMQPEGSDAPESAQRELRLMFK